METSDFDEDYDEYDDDESISDDINDIKDNYKDLKKSVKDYKNSKNNPSNEARDFNNKLKERNMARSNGATNTATSGTATSGTAAGGTAAGGTAAGGAAAGGAATGGAAAGGAAAGGAATGGAAAGGAAAGGTAAGGAAAASATGVGAIVVAAIALLASLKKLQDKMDKKAKDKGFDLKLYRRLLTLSPLALVVVVILAVLLVLMLIMQTGTLERADVLQKAIKCAETNGCKDFMNTKINISAAGFGLNSADSSFTELVNNSMNGKLETDNKITVEEMSATFSQENSKKFIYFTDLQIARFVVEYLMFENRYFGSTDTINELYSIITEEAKGTSEKDKSFIQKVFKLLIDNSIIGDIREAYSLFNWLKLEKMAFNSIEWHIYYTGVSGTGLSIVDDTLNLYCQDRDDAENNWWISDKLKEFCNDKKVTEQLTFKVLGSVDPFTANLYVPTTLWSAGDAAINAADVFGITDLSIFENWKANALPDQEKLVNAVYEYLPSGIEIYAVFANTHDLDMANKVYEYYVDAIKNGEFAITVSLYALRDYDIIKTIDLGDRETVYNIYKDGKLLDSGSNLTEEKMKEFVNDYTENEKVGEICEKNEGTGEKVCQDERDDVWQAIKRFAVALENAVRKLWADVKDALGTGWYYASNVAKDFLYTKFPLTLSSNRSWVIAVNKGSTFDSFYEWEYSVGTSKDVKVLKGEDSVSASETFDNKKELGGRAEGWSDNKSKIEGGTVISSTIIYRNTSLEVEQLTKYINIAQEVTSMAEYLDVKSSKKSPYTVDKKQLDNQGNKIIEKVEYDNRLAYVIETINESEEEKYKDFNYNSDEYGAAYEAIRQYKGESYLSNGIYTDYSGLSTDAYGWPLESIARPQISSCTGLRNEVFGSGTEQHGGDDLPAPANTKILAAKDGKVIVNRYMGGKKGYGYYVVLKHADGWYTLYGHMIKQSPLSEGEDVKAGQVVGYVGSTGASSGNHLHFEIRHASSGESWGIAQKVEPMLYVQKNTIPDNIIITADNCVDSSKFGSLVSNEKKNESLEDNKTNE